MLDMLYLCPYMWSQHVPFIFHVFSPKRAKHYTSYFIQVVHSVVVVTAKYEGKIWVKPMEEMKSSSNTLRLEIMPDSERQIEIQVN